MKDYLLELNDFQREAVLYDDGPSLVVAGAGSGKTRVLTYKIAHLLQNGYQPHSILALTFTNKAAREMKERLAAITDEYVTRYLWMGTFHSIFCSILRREAQHIGYDSNFTIYDANDSKSLIKSIIKEMQLDEKTYRPGVIQNRISNAKNGLVTSKAYIQEKGFRDYDYRSKIPLTGEIYQRYSARCYNAGVMDFDDLLLQTNILFRDHPTVLHKYQEQFRYVLVDEYQDTNLAQHLIVKRLCENHLHVFVVGDDAQSIYSFRGANIDNMLRFQDNYPTCRVFKLERNYRSTRNIVDAANSLITKNKEQIHKTVYSEKEKGSKLSLVSAYSDYDEAYMVSSKIMDMIHYNDYSFSDFAILYRTNAQSRVLEETLRNRTIKYRVYGAQSFYQRKEIKDVIAYLRVIINPKDEEALKRIINYPLRGIGGTTFDRLQAAAVAEDVSLWAVISNPSAYRLATSKGTEHKISLFCRLIEGFVEENRTATAVEIATTVIKESGVRDVLYNDSTVEGISRLQNVQELLNAINQFVTMRLEQGLETVSLTDFLMEVALITDQDNDRDENADKVSLMTVHAAKGLEFRNVFIVGMENDLFPSGMCMDSPRAVEEERRLFYVAITRAQENCIITFAQNRFRNGQTNSASPSFFLEDIEAQYIDIAGEIELPSHGYGRTTASYSSSRSPSSSSWDKVRSTSSSGTIQSSPSPASSSSDKLQSIGALSTGDRVIHTMFGEGEILTLEGKNENAKAVISFANSGVKTLLLKYAKLKKV